MEDGQTFETPTCQHQDYLTLHASASAGNKTGYITNFTDLNLSTTLYPYVRYRCQSYSGAAKYKIVAEYDDASTSTIIDEGTSTTFIAGSTALTAAKTLDHLRFYCNNSANIVRYDFALVYAGDFTLPNGAYGINGTIPNRNVHLQIPSRQTTITQMLGSEDFEVNIGCDLTKGNWTKDGLAIGTSTDYVQGQVFYDIVHNAKNEAWQWLDTEREQMKVTLDPVRFSRAASGDRLTDRMDLTFKEYRLSDAGNATETYETRWGLNL